MRSKLTHDGLLNYILKKKKARTPAQIKIAFFGELFYFNGILDYIRELCQSSNQLIFDDVSDIWVVALKKKEQPALTLI